MGRGAAVGVVLSVVAAVLCTPGVAMGRTLVVGSGAGCADGRFATIQAALDAAQPGDQVPVCPGTYREKIRVRADRVKLYSRKRHAAVIELPSGPSPGGALVSLDGSQVLLRGFTITGIPPGGVCTAEQEEAINAFAPATIDYNRIVDFGCESFRLAIDNFIALGFGRFSVAHNEITGFTGIGVRLGGQGPAVVNSNRITGGQIGVLHGDSHFGAPSGLIQDNTIEDAELGVYVDGFEQEGFQARVSGNRLRRNGAGIRVTGVGQGVPGDLPTRVRVDRNRVLDSGSDGIVMDGSPAFVYRNRSLGSGRYDCLNENADFVRATWKDNVGLTDNPSNLCRAP